MDTAGRSWAATTTEGLMTYSLDSNLVFDPFHLEMDVTPENVQKSLQKRDYSVALMLSFRLNERSLIQQTVENIPMSNGKHICYLYLILCVVSW